MCWLLFFQLLYVSLAVAPFFPAQGFVLQSNDLAWHDPSMFFAFFRLSPAGEEAAVARLVSKTNLHEQTSSLYHLGFQFKGIQQHFFKLLFREEALRAAEGLGAWARANAGLPVEKRMVAVWDWLPQRLANDPFWRIWYIAIYNLATTRGIQTCPQRNPSWGQKGIRCYEKVQPLAGQGNHAENQRRFRHVLFPHLRFENLHWGRLTNFQKKNKGNPIPPKMCWSTHSSLKKLPYNYMVKWLEVYLTRDRQSHNNRGPQSLKENYVIPSQFNSTYFDEKTPLVVFHWSHWSWAPRAQLWVCAMMDLDALVWMLRELHCPKDSSQLEGSKVHSHILYSIVKQC